MSERKRTPVFWICVGAGVALVVGTIGPWARVFFVQFSGLDIDGGFVVLMCGVALIVLPFIYDAQRTAWPCALSIVAASIALLFLLAFSVSVWGDSSEGEKVFGVDAADVTQPGWGLYLAWLAAGAGLCVSIALVVEQRAYRRRAVHYQQPYYPYVQPPQYPPYQPPPYQPPAAPPPPPQYDPSKPAGWYQHPGGDWRWWDGYRWTDHRP